MTNYSVEQYAQSSVARQESYDAITETAEELLKELRAVVTRPDDTSIPGWRIKRIPINGYEVEIALCESTDANIPLVVPAEEARDVTIVVKRGKLHVTYADALGGFDIEQGSATYLVGGVQRATFAAIHPTTLLAVIYGRPIGERSNAAFQLGRVVSG